jgi:hypothetical protein
MEGSADFIDVGSVAADRFVELVAGDAELFGPVGDVGRHLGVNLLGVVRAFSVILMYCVGFVGFGRVVVLGHGVLPLFSFFL